MPLKNVIVVLVINMDLRCWQSKIADNTEVLKLNCVGTHDCVTKYVQLSHISRCQNKDIYEQLCMGIRGLDIRVTAKGKRLLMVHGIAKAFNSPNRLSKQMDMRDVLKKCYEFLDENPSETIIFQFKNDNEKQMEQCFDNMYNTYITPNKSKWFLENRSPLLGEARGKIIFIRRCRKYDLKKYPLGTGIDFSGWVEQDIATPEALTLATSGKNKLTFLIQDRFKYKPEAKWKKCVKPFLDAMKPFDGTYIINYLSTAGGVKGPYRNSKYINPEFMTYELNKNYYYGMIYTDFPNEELVEKVVKTNYENK